MAATLPYAYSAAAGCIVHVSSVSRGLGCNCFCQYCEHRLIAKKGQVKEHHFAHYKDNPDCSFESWLHATAKNMLAERINAGSGVEAIWDCADFECELRHTATFGVEHSAELERGISGASIRPDITVNKGGEATTYIEVVVSHKPEYPMDAAGAPVAIWEVSQHDLDRLSDGTVAFRSWHGMACPNPICEGCGRRIVSAGCICHAIPAIKARAWASLKQMRHPRQGYNLHQDWLIDGQGHRMSGMVLGIVRRNADWLARRGWFQHRVKPWVFTYNVPGGKIYAYLSGNVVIPIWEYREPSVYMWWNRPCAKDEYESAFREWLCRYAAHILITNQVVSPDFELNPNPPY